MEASAFDTNRYANRLVAAGVTQESANIQAEAIGEAMQEILKLDAKVEKYHAADLVEFAAIRAQLSQIDAKVTKDLAEQRVLISEVEKRLMRWILIVGGALGIIQGLLAFVPRLLG